MSRLDDALAGPMRQCMKYSGGKYWPKKKFATATDAHDAADDLGDPKLKVYKCDICGHWHLGHS